MIGWIVLAVAFFLFGAGCFIDALVHRSKTERAMRERDEAREQRDTLNTENTDLFRALKESVAECDGLALQLDEATKTKPIAARKPRAKKTEAQP